MCSPFCLAKYVTSPHVNGGLQTTRVADQFCRYFPNTQSGQWYPYISPLRINR